jgi:crotonobetainyl-CoA:carnitine CoA-transferase CaiB-like acyl-CoA transferase
MGPLSGIRVVELSVMISGPLAAMLLADQGAEVVKVEQPGMGDLMRFLGTHRGGMTGLYANNNRGKRSVVVDLKTEGGREVLGRLVERADVVVQNFRPGALAKLGFGPDDCLARNPRLVYLSITGFGPTGPRSRQRVYDHVMQAASGVAGVQADPATGTPSFVRTLVCDKATAYTAAQAVTAALLARERGLAGGQHVELSMLDASVAFLWPDAGMDATLLADDATRLPTLAANYRMTRFADGWAAAAAGSDAEFVGMCRALQRPDLANDPRFAGLAARTAHQTELVAALAEAALAVPLAEFLAAADVHDVPASAVTTLDALPADAQVRHNELFVERKHPEAGPVREPRPAPRFSATPAAVAAPARLAGADTDAVVAELGLDPVALRAAGAVA